MISSFFLWSCWYSNPMPVFPVDPEPKERECDPFLISKTNSYRGLRSRPFPSSNLSSLNLLRKKVIVSTQSSKKHLLRCFKREKTALRSFPEIEESQLFPRIMRKVSSDGYLSYQGKGYAVPFILSGTEVWIDDFLGRTITAYNQKNEVITQCDMRF